MDPATAGSLAIGVVSLAFDLFENSVKLFKFLSSMVDMPKECEQCRLQLMIEYNRLLAWGEAVGLMDVPKESHIAVSLGTNAVELCSIISRIAWLLGEFKELNARWQNEVKASPKMIQMETKTEDLDVAREISSLAIAFEKTQEERKHLRGTKRIHELMGDYRGKRIHDITASSYREMVILRNDVTELRNMVDAVTNLIKTSHITHWNRNSNYNDNDETLRDLLRLKEINRISEDLMVKLRDSAEFDIQNDLQRLTSVKHYDTDLLDKNFINSKERISLAWKLASSLLYLHTANWLHKGFHSGNVIFVFDEGRFNVEKPMLSGFEFSRPESEQTTSRSPNPQWDIYRWPGIQGEAPTTKNSRKTYDIYSLGLVLLEIAHWRPLHEIMCLKRWPEPSRQDSRIRAWLLKEESFPPYKDADPIGELRDIAGDKYWRAVNRCIVAHGKLGMRRRKIMINQRTLK
ncbi:prion-inhibition and propagation-domain-containing protein [Penicillium sp. IBT 35674x]|nr:prion-inhibition and propagation-domain-containing protein [Penicillium sp. IBT 35674x]